MNVRETKEWVARNKRMSSHGSCASDSRSSTTIIHTYPCSFRVLTQGTQVTSCRSNYPIRSPEYILSSRIPIHPVIMLKKKLLSILTNYLTDANYMHLERNKLRSNGPPPLYQGAKRRLATEADHTT
ncbi:hypothetical protein LXL04_006591 [Taraxacum kok-saghyz]